MIATNYRKHPEAMALQLPLPFGHVLRWALRRPGARILRAIRAARAAAFKAAGRIAYPVKPATPQWWKDAKRAARDLAATVRDACIVLWAEVRVADTDPPRLLGFNYSEDLTPAWPTQDTPDNIRKANNTPPNRYRQRVMNTARRYNEGCPRCDHCWVTIVRSPMGDADWFKCTNCHASWHPQHRDQAKRELEYDDTEE